jgi:hypothetical protein
LPPVGRAPPPARGRWRWFEAEYPLPRDIEVADRNHNCYIAEMVSM